MWSTQPLDTRQFNTLSTDLEQHMAQYGYSKVDTPIIQPADLFLTRAGDQIIDHLFTFERRGQQYALRPEFTASAAARYAQQHHPGDVARWQFSGPIFEDDPASTTVSAQRYGIGAELLGLAGPFAEAEVIAMAAHGLTRQGIRGWTLILGSVQLMRHLLGSFRLDSRAQRFLLAQLPALMTPDQGKAYVLEALDKLLVGGIDSAPIASSGLFEEGNTQQMLDVLLDTTQRGATMGGRTRHDITRRLVQKRQRAAERDQFIRALDFLAAWSQIDLPCAEAFSAVRRWINPDDSRAGVIFADWQRLIDLLDAYDIPAGSIRLQPALSRNWDYYTGIVFELHGANNSRLGGGGRYDELAHLLGAEHDIPAFGFTYYADALLSQMPPAPEPPQRALHIGVRPESESAAARWSQALRERGCAVTVSAASPANQGLNVEADGSLKWNGQTYSLDSIDQLIASLECPNA